MHLAATAIVNGNPQKSYWWAGNAALRRNDFEAALTLYSKAKIIMPELAYLIESNIQIALRHMDTGLTFSSKQTSAEIEIIVPVFNALDDVKKCLQSLNLYTDGLGVHVIVVNDGSNIATRQWLDDYCNNNSMFTLINHSTNQGYTKAINVGIKYSTAPYVILLNSDTIVTPRWLKGMLRCMQSSANVGIVGPLSNAATWQTVPILRDDSGAFCVNDLPSGLDVNGMAQLVACVSLQTYPRLANVNGFCFMISRKVFETIGYFDEENFPVGYGEEDDFCIRASDAGFELAIADDVFVFHAKSKSFGHKQRISLTRQGVCCLKRKHTPEKYNARFILLERNQEIKDVRTRVQRAISLKNSAHVVYVGECVRAKQALDTWRKQVAGKHTHSLLVLAGTPKMQLFPASWYIRLILPYQSEYICKKWNVCLIQFLPEPTKGDVVIINRQAIGFSLPDLRAWMVKWKAGGGKIVYDIDDDMLDIEALKERGYTGNVSSISETVQFLAQQANIVHVSTAHLGERISAFNGSIRVIPNGLDSNLWRLKFSRTHEDGPFQRQSNGPVRIGYIGTPTHDADLDLVTEAMQIIEKKYGGAVEIEVIGGFEKRMPTFGKRVEIPKNNTYFTFVDWLYERVHWDIGIIPLANSDFNKSKSYLKFLEYAALDMAIVVSDSTSYHPVAKHGVNCLLAKSTTDEWVEMLSLLIEDKALRLRLAARARIECISYHTLESIVPSLAEGLQTLIDWTEDSSLGISPTEQVLKEKNSYVEKVKTIANLDLLRKKFTLISMVKNEKNIIEIFAAHSLAMFDRVIFIDHQSTDGTGEYLKALANCYPQFEYFLFDEAGFYKSEVMTWVVKNIVGPSDDGWIFFLDADEYLPFLSRTEFDEIMAKYSIFPVISLNWLNLIPTNMTTERIKGSVFLKPPTPARMRKIAFQPSLVPLNKCVIQQGQHNLMVGDTKKQIHPAQSAFPLYHIPIRTKEQLRDKITKGVEAYRKMGRDRADKQGFHWEEISSIIDRNGISDELMADMVARYSEPLTSPYGKSRKDLAQNGYSEMLLNLCTLDKISSFDEYIWQKDVSFCKYCYDNDKMDGTSKRELPIVLDEKSRTLRFNTVLIKKQNNTVKMQ